MYFRPVLYAVHNPFPRFPIRNFKYSYFYFCAHFKMCICKFCYLNHFYHFLLKFIIVVRMKDGGFTGSDASEGWGFETNSGEELAACDSAHSPAWHPRHLTIPCRTQLTRQNSHGFQRCYLWWQHRWRKTERVLAPAVESWSSCNCDPWEGTEAAAFPECSRSTLAHGDLKWPWCLTAAPFDAGVWWLAFYEFYSTCRITCYVRNIIISVSHFWLYGADALFIPILLMHNKTSRFSHFQNFIKLLLYAQQSTVEMVYRQKTITHTANNLTHRRATSNVQGFWKYKIIRVLLFYADAENERHSWIAYDIDSCSAGVTVQIFGRCRQCVSTAGH